MSTLLRAAILFLLMTGGAWAADADDIEVALAKKQNCALKWPIVLNVVDAHGVCVGTLIEVNPSIVTRRIGNHIYGFFASATGVPKGEAFFYYPTADCSGTAYMPDDNELPPFLFADTNGTLWGIGPPPPGGTINVKSGRQAPAGACTQFTQAGLLVGEATAIDTTLVNGLTPPLSVPKP